MLSAASRECQVRELVLRTSILFAGHESLSLREIALPVLSHASARTRESRWKVLKTEIKSNKFNFKQYAKTSEILKVFLTKDFVEAHRCPRRIFPAYVYNVASRREKQQTTQTHLNAAEGKLYPGVATLARVSSTISWLVERLSSESEREKLSEGRRRAGTAPGKSETNKVRGKKEREMQPRV